MPPNPAFSLPNKFSFDGLFATLLLDEKVFPRGLERELESGDGEARPWYTFRVRTGDDTRLGVVVATAEVVVVVVMVLLVLMLLLRRARTAPPQTLSFHCSALGASV